MAISWRSLVAPNQSGANNLTKAGSDSVTQGLAALSGALRQPTIDAQNAEKERVAQAMQLVGLQQGQQRLDNQDAQAQAQLAQGDRRLDIGQSQHESDQQFKERQQSKGYKQQLKVLGLNQDFKKEQTLNSQDFTKEMAELGYANKKEFQQSQNAFKVEERLANQEYSTAAKAEGYKNAKEAREAGFAFKYDMSKLDRDQREKMQKNGFTHAEQMQDSSFGHQADILEQKGEISAEAAGVAQAGRVALQDDAQEFTTGRDRVLNRYETNRQGAATDGKLEIERLKQKAKADEVAAKNVAAQAKAALKSKGPSAVARQKKFQQGKPYSQGTGLSNFLASNDDMSKDGKAGMGSLVDQAQQQGIPEHSFTALMQYAYDDRSWKSLGGDDESNIENSSYKTRKAFINKFLKDNPGAVINPSSSSAPIDTSKLPDIFSK